MKGPHLTRALVLEGEVRTPDGAGGFAEVWTALGTLWAEVVAGSGGEASNEAIVTAGISYRITVRGAGDGASSRPKAGQRFREGARAFRILAVTERDAGGQYLTCFAREEEPV